MSTTYQNANTLKINITDDNGTEAPLYFEYPQQISPQPAYLEFDPALGALELSAEYKSSIGNGCSVDVFNGVVLHFAIPASSSRAALEDLKNNAEVIALLNRIKAGFEVRDGKGVKTEDAQEAEWELDRFFDTQLETVQVWTAEEWLENADILADLKEHKGDISALAASYIREFDEGALVADEDDVIELINEALADEE